MYCAVVEIIHARRNNKWCQVPFSQMLKIINSYPRVMICKTHELFLQEPKLYITSIQNTYTLAVTMDCSKMLKSLSNQGLFLNTVIMNL